MHMNTRANNPMIQKHDSALPLSRIAAALALSLSLVACGESDLEAIHAERIKEAIAEAGENDGGGQTDDTTVPSSSGGEQNAPEQNQSEQNESTEGNTEGAPASEGEATPSDENVEVGAANPELIEEPTPSAATQEAIDIAEYSLAFNDEFNTSSLDSAKWNTAMAWGADLTINDEQQYYIDTQNDSNAAFNPFTFDGEAITINAVPTPAGYEETANNLPFVSGALSTINKFDFSYGYAEVRIDVPEGAGLWPSFWMLGSEFEDLKPQLYMMEFNGSNPNSFYHNYNYTDADGNLRSPRQHEVVVNGASEGWQTMGLRWSDQELLFFVNGYPTFQVNGENVPSQAMYLIMNLAVGGLWVEDPDETTPNPAELKVDYIRVYQRN